LNTALEGQVFGVGGVVAERGIWSVLAGGDEGVVRVVGECFETGV